MKRKNALMVIPIFGIIIAFVGLFTFEGHELISNLGIIISMIGIAQILAASKETLEEDF